MDEHQRIEKKCDAILERLLQHERHGLSHGQLTAQSISIMTSSRTKCVGGCLFCISRTTPECVMQEDNQLHYPDPQRLQVGLDFAARCGATTAILTGKADPLQDKNLIELIRQCCATMPCVDIHTNGFLLKRKYQLHELIQAGLTMITFSIASFNQGENWRLMGLPRDFSPGGIVAEACRQGLLVRCSLVLTKKTTPSLQTVMYYLEKARLEGAHQVVIRELWLPDLTPENQDNEVYQWNRDNFVSLPDIMAQFEKLVDGRHDGFKVKFLYNLPWGTPVFDVNGLNVTFARCQESYNGSTLKSIVHKIDGHGYKDWDHVGSILY